MDHTERVDISTLSLPHEIVAWIGNAAVYESSGQSGAKTVYIDRDGGAYLKIADYGTLSLASKMQEYFCRHQMSSPVLRYLSAGSTDKDYLITAPLKGESGISEKYISEPKRLCEIFAQSLRLLHDVDVSECPVKNKMSEMVRMVKEASFRQDYLDDFAGYIGTADADKAAEEIARSSGMIQNDVLIHGDYCLPNIILNDWAFEGFIDVADGGAGDRHYDLAWGLWTLNLNLKSPKYGQYFIDAYGRGYVDKERLRICALLAAME